MKLLSSILVGFEVRRLSGLVRARRLERKIHFRPQGGTKTYESKEDINRSRRPNDDRVATLDKIGCLEDRDLPPTGPTDPVRGELRPRCGSGKRSPYCGLCWSKGRSSPGTT